MRVNAPQIPQPVTVRAGVEGIRVPVQGVTSLGVAGGIVTSGVAGVSPRARISNPLGSGRVVRLVGTMVSFDIRDLLRLTFVSPAPALINDFPVISRDSSAVDQPAALVTAETLVGQAIDLQVELDTAFQYLPWEFLLHPDEGLDFWRFTDNTQFGIAFWWEEIVQ